MSADATSIAADKSEKRMVRGPFKPWHEAPMLFWFARCIGGDRRGSAMTQRVIALSLLQGTPMSADATPMAADKSKRRMVRGQFEPWHEAHILFLVREVHRRQSAWHRRTSALPGSNPSGAQSQLAASLLRASGGLAAR